MEGAVYMAIISINNGYWGTKVKTDQKEFMFESKIQQTLDEYETNVITLNNTQIVVGKGTHDIELNKTSSDVQRACVIMALKKGGIQYAKVMSALPVNTYINKSARGEYREWLLGIEGIRETKVYMEGAAAVLADLNWYKGKLIALMDIGGLTINCMIFEDGKLVNNTATSLNLGTIILENRIKTALQQSSLVNVPDYQIKYLIQQDNHIIRTVVNQYVEEIKQELKKLEYPTNIQFRCTGGGAIRFYDVFKKCFNAYIHQDSIWENVRGLHLMGQVVWG